MPEHTEEERRKKELRKALGLPEKPTEQPSLGQRLQEKRLSDERQQEIRGKLGLGAPTLAKVPVAPSPISPPRPTQIPPFRPRPITPGILPPSQLGRAISEQAQPTREGAGLGKNFQVALLRTAAQLERIQGRNFDPWHRRRIQEQIPEFEEGKILSPAGMGRILGDIATLGLSELPTDAEWDKDPKGSAMRTALVGTGVVAGPALKGAFRGGRAALRSPAGEQVKRALVRADVLGLRKIPGRFRPGLPDVQFPASGTTPRLSSMDEHIKHATEPGNWRTLANWRPVKEVMGLLNPASIANNAGAKAVIGYFRLMLEGRIKAQTVFAGLRSIGMPGEKALVSRIAHPGRKELFGASDAKGFLSGERWQGKDMTLGDLVASRKDLKVMENLTPTEKAWVRQAGEVEDALTQMLKDEGIDVNLLTFEDGFAYATRQGWPERLRGKLVNGKWEDVHLGIVGKGKTPGGSRIGARLPSEKIRYYKTEKEGIDAGMQYIPYEEALRLRIAGVYNRVAGKRLEDHLGTLDLIDEGAFAQLALSKQSAEARATAANEMLAAFGRASNNKRVKLEELEEIARQFPKEGKALSDFIASGPGGTPTRSLKKLKGQIQDQVNSANKKHLDVTKRFNIRKKEIDTAQERGAGYIAGQGPQGRGVAEKHPSLKNLLFTDKQVAEGIAKGMDDGLIRALDKARLSSYKSLTTTSEKAGLVAARAARGVEQLNELSRYFMLAGDASTFGIQLLPMLFSNPILFSRAMWAFARTFTDETYLAKRAAQHQDLIANNPELMNLFGRGQHELTAAMAPGGLLSPGQRNKLLGVPGALLRPFARAFEGSLTEAGFLLRKSLAEDVVDASSRHKVNTFINSFRGLSESERLGVNPTQRWWETMIGLAPRYGRAIASILHMTTRGGIDGTLAREKLGQATIGLMATMYGIGRARGDSHEEATERLMPFVQRERKGKMEWVANTGFMNFNLVGQNFGPGTKFRSVVMLLAQSAADPMALLGGSKYRDPMPGGNKSFLQDPKGYALRALSMDSPAMRFARGQLSPSAGKAIDLSTGKNYFGDPVYGSIPHMTKEIVAEGLMPLTLQGMLMEGGTLEGRAVRGVTEFFGGRAYPQSSYDLLNNLSKEQWDLPYADLEDFERKIVREVASAELKGAQLKRILRGDSNAKYWSAIDEQDNERFKKEEALVRLIGTGPYRGSGAKYAIQQRYRMIQAERAAAVAVINDQYGKYQGDEEFNDLHPGKAAKERYYEAFRIAKRDDGSIDFDFLDWLLTQLYRDLTRDQRDYIIRNTNMTTHPPGMVSWLSRSTRDRIYASEAARESFLKKRRRR